MQLFLFDPSPAERHRNWKDMLPATYSEVIWDWRAKKFLLKGGNEIEAPGLLIAHESEMEQPPEQLSYVETRGLHCLIISGGPISDIGLGCIGGTGHVYRRKEIVAPGQNAIDQHFISCLQRFWEDFDTHGIPNWDLIEPYPEHTGLEKTLNDLTEDFRKLLLQDKPPTKEKLDNLAKKRDEEFRRLAEEEAKQLADNRR
ncbi:MAG: hypothetical protein MN733_12045 [Nitrososphaera sp.]|nr:hypothetical protein [Nitrososphaera sp.]